MIARSQFCAKYCELLGVYWKEDKEVPIDFVGSSYARYLQVTTDRRASLYTRGKRRDAAVILLPTWISARLLSASGWGATMPLRPFVEKGVRVPWLLRELPLFHSPSELFTIQHMKEHHPKVVVLLAGLNDVLMWYEANGNAVPLGQGRKVVVRYYVQKLVEAVRMQRRAYGKPYPFVLWLGMGRVKYGRRYPKELCNWLDNIEMQLNNSVGESWWPSWLLFIPLIRASMQENLHSQNPTADQLHWTSHEADVFGQMMLAKLEWLRADGSKTGCSEWETQNGLSHLLEEE